MRSTLRPFAATLAFATAVLAPASVITQPTPEWQIGDVFVGIGRFGDHPGQYLVYSPQGLQKEGLTDLSAATITSKRVPIGVTTGCMVAPPTYGDALYTTTFYARRVIGFEAVHPHFSSLAASVEHPGVAAIESIVFDNQGNYYVSGLPLLRDRSSEPVPPQAFIFKYRRVGGVDVLQETYEVPNGTRGADWIDLGTDQQTFYYTSQGETIHEFRPASSPGGAYYREIQLHYPGGQSAAGSSYGVRALPPRPGDATLRPSGFLVAMHSGIFRVTYDGEVVQRYDIEGGNSGQYFGLNIAPDGQSFWTATFQADDPALPLAGNLYQFHIASAALMRGPIPVRDIAGNRARSVWGICVKREYTAAANVCFDMDASGAPKVDPAGRPIQMACRVPEICAPQGRDDDGDGLADAQDPDCTPPVVPPIDPPQTLDCSAAKASASTWPPNHQWVPITIDGVVGPNGAPAAITIAGILQDEPTDTTGDGKSAIDGQGIGTSVAQIRVERAGDARRPGNGRIYEILFSAQSGAASCAGSATVGVPHDQGKGPAIDDGIRYDSTIRGGDRVR